MFCNFDIFSLMFMEMQRIKGFVLGKLNNVSGQNSFSAKAIEGKREKIVFYLVTTAVVFFGWFGMCASGWNSLPTNAAEFTDAHVWRLDKSAELYIHLALE